MRKVILNEVAGLSGLKALVALLCLAGQTAWAQAPARSAYDFEGRVVAAREAEVAARIDGLLAKIHFTRGQIVEQGDLLFTFDATFPQLSVASAEAGLDLLRAELQLAEAKLKNAGTLRERNVSSEMQFLEAQAQRDVAAARVEEARIKVKVARLRLDQTSLFAPISGIVSQPFVREGAYITLEAMQKNRLAVVTQLDPIQVIGQIPVDLYLHRRQMFGDLDEAKDALGYSLFLPNGEMYPHQGRLIAVTGQFNATSQRIAIALEFPNPGYLLRPGLKVQLVSRDPAR